MPRLLWTEDELSTLRASYGRIAYFDIPPLLPKRSIRAIAAKARELGIEADLALSAAIRRIGYRRHSLDYKYFSIPTRENCYWGGFIAADGCVSRTQTPRLTIKLNAKDHDHLLLLSRAIKFTGDVGHSTARCNGKVFQVSSLNMAVQDEFLDDLERRFGITERKSLTLNPPRLSATRHIAPFIVGYIDGDGCISYSSRDRSFRLGIRGTMAMLTWIKDTFDGWWPSKKPAMISTADGYPKYQLSGERLMAIAGTLMAHSPIALARKWDRLKR